MRHRIFLIEDHPIVRRGMTELINYESDLEVCGSAEDGPTGLQQIKLLNPDLVMLDLGLRGRSGLEVLKDIKASHPKQRVMILSMHDESVYAPRVLRAGACGYVMKREATETLLSAIRQVLAGGIYLSVPMEKRLLKGLVRGRGGPVLDPIETLTDRELEVFRLIGLGKTTREIAEELCLSAKTVETHRVQLKAKLNVKSVTELVRRAVQFEERGLT